MPGVSEPPLALGFVVGLRAEARLAARHGDVAIGGGGPDGAAAAAERLRAAGATALVSFGLAGGLDPALRAGTLLIPSEIRSDDGRYRTDPELVHRLGGPSGGTIYAGRRIAATAADKRMLFERMGAVAIDLESEAVARAAARHGIGFAVVRAICDPAGRDLPPAALTAIGAGGGIGLLRVLGSLLAQPGQIPALLRLAGDAVRARRGLASLTFR